MVVRIGAGGSATDPFHNGHLAVLRAVLSSRLFDKVIWYPSGFSDFKPDITLSDHRATMAMLGVPQQWLYNPLPGWAELELRLEDVYHNDKPTYERLIALQERYKGAEVTFFTGSDAVTRTNPDDLFPIQKWSYAERLWKEKILLLTRVGFAQPEDVPDLPANISWLPTESEGISSSQIRAMIKAGNSAWEKLVPPQVCMYIKHHRLYERKCDEAH